MEGLCFEIKDQHLWLLPQKAIFWEEQKMLMLSDLHFGKSSHFRKAGIPVSTKVFQKDLDVLSRLLEKLSPATICFLGDLFHSDINIEFEWFHDWMKKYTEVKMELVRGNHDIFPASVYKQAGIKVFPLAVHKGPFVFAHDPQYNGGIHDFVISGHIHPGVQLKGTGRQSLCLPCFYFGEKQALIPAFGEFTGLALIQPKKNDKVFVIGNGKVHQIEV